MGTGLPSVLLVTVGGEVCGHGLRNVKFPPRSLTMLSGPATPAAESEPLTRNVQSPVPGPSGQDSVPCGPLTLRSEKDEFSHGRETETGPEISAGHTPGGTEPSFRP